MTAMSAMSAMTWEEATARRMARHGLSEPLSAERGAGVGPAAVATVLGAVHAQVLSAAELSIGRRLAGATRTDVQRALWEDRTLVKTFGPRGTVHLLATDDLPMWTGALSALPSSVPLHPEPVRFTADEAEEVIAAIGDALATTELTVDELTEAIGDRAGGWAVERTMDAFQDKWPRWRQLTSTAGQRGVLCFGPNRGRKVTYTNPHRWRPGFRPDPGETALEALVTRYLHAYGPATPQDFAKWLGIRPRSATDLFAALAGEDRALLEPVTLDGDPAWILADDAAPGPPASPATPTPTAGSMPPPGSIAAATPVASVGPTLSVSPVSPVSPLGSIAVATPTPTGPYEGLCLLPYFDAYAVAGRPRERLYPGAAAARALSPTGQAGNYPVLLVDGVVGGVWHMRRSGRKLTITVEPLDAHTPLTATRRRQLDAEVDLIATVLEATPTLVVGPVTVGPHA